MRTLLPFAAQSQLVGDIPQHDQEYNDIAYLNTLGSQDGNFLTCNMEVNAPDVTFKVDTGSVGTVISEDISKALGLDTLQTMLP